MAEHLWGVVHHSSVFSRWTDIRLDTCKSDMNERCHCDQFLLYHPSLAEENAYLTACLCAWLSVCITKTKPPQPTTFWLSYISSCLLLKAHTLLFSFLTWECRRCALVFDIYCHLVSRIRSNAVNLCLEFVQNVMLSLKN